MFLMVCTSCFLFSHVPFKAPDRVKVAGLSSWKPLEKLPPVMSAEMVLYVLFMMDNDSQTPWPAGPT